MMIQSEQRIYKYCFFIHKIDALFLLIIIPLNPLIGPKLFADVKNRVDSVVLMMHGRTIVDAAILEVPSSAKNQDGEQNPEMDQTKKGNHWRYGMKVHIGVDAGTGYVCNYPIKFIFK